MIISQNENRGTGTEDMQETQDSECYSREQKSLVSDISEPGLYHNSHFHALFLTCISQRSHEKRKKSKNCEISRRSKQNSQRMRCQSSFVLRLKNALLSHLLLKKQQQQANSLCSETEDATDMIRCHKDCLNDDEKNNTTLPAVSHKDM